MKKRALFAAIFVCTTIAVTSVSAQMTYQNNSLSVQNIDVTRVYVDSSPTGSVGEITGALNKIVRLKPVQWGQNTSITIPYNVAALVPIDSQPNKGFRISELETVIPAAVGGVGTGYVIKKRVNYNALIPYLVAAIKEQNAEIVALKAEVQALKNR